MCPLFLITLVHIKCKMCGSTDDGMKLQLLPCLVRDTLKKIILLSVKIIYGPTIYQHVIVALLAARPSGPVFYIVSASAVKC